MTMLAFAACPGMDVRSAISRANELISIAAEHRAAHKVRKPSLREKMSVKLDEFLEETLPHVENVEGIAQVFQRHYAMTPSDIGQLPACLVPLAIVRELFSKHRVVFNEEQVPSWDRFSSIYSGVAYV